MRNKLIRNVLFTSIVCIGVFAGAIGAGWSPKLGLDLAGGLSVVYKPAHTATQAELNTAVNVMDDRLNGLGVSQPNVTTQGNEIVVQLPGVKNPQQVLTIIGATAQLFFRPVLAGAPAYVPPKGTNAKSTPYVAPPAPQAPYIYSAKYFVPGASGQTGGLQPPAADIEDPIYRNYKTTPSSQDNPSQYVILPANPGDGLGSPRLVLGPAEIAGHLASGVIIGSASAQLSQSAGWEVVFNLTSSGSTVFNDIASTYYHTLVADDLDGNIITAPIIDAQSFPGSGTISGNFNSTTASNVALDLNYGSLPIRLVAQTTQSVSPSLGKSSLDAGLIAGIVGLILVMGYTILYYRALGIVVIVGLATTAAFLYGFVSMLGHSALGLTLDLSGVTGLIVSIGITVDSYIVYFERLKDEVRAGRSIRQSVDKSFKSAYRTILSADAVSFIAAVVLWKLSVGAVQGFAFMLGLSTIVDVITSYFFTRPLVILLGRNRLFTEAKWLGVARGLAAGADVKKQSAIKPTGVSS